MKIVGLFIEPRSLKQIYYNISNFFELFKNSKLYFFCGKNLYKKYKILEKKYKLLIIRELEVNDLNSYSYSDFMKNIDLWNSLDGEYCITIQTDGCLCKNSKYNINEFLKYDYIGGGRYHYWNNIYSKFDTLNGGFSLRNIKVMIDILTKIKPLKTKKIYFFNKLFNDKIYNIKTSPEDSYFYNGCKLLNYNIGEDINSTKFALHEINDYKYNHFCIHKINPKYFGFNEIDEILQYCHDYKYYIKPIYDDNNIIISNRELENNVYKLKKKKKYYFLRYYLIIFFLYLLIYISYLYIYF